MNRLLLWMGLDKNKKRLGNYLILLINNKVKRYSRVFDCLVYDRGKEDGMDEKLKRNIGLFSRNV
jgi:hypothetical protein